MRNFIEHWGGGLLRVIGRAGIVVLASLKLKRLSDRQVVEMFCWVSISGQPQKCDLSTLIFALSTVEFKVTRTLQAIALNCRKDSPRGIPR